MATHNELGKEGENQAAAYLIKEGYKILETNWTWQKAEVDIIAMKKNTLVVVEVKTRSSLEHGLPQEFVKPRQIQRLVKAINEYIIRHNLDITVRFDIIAIHKKDSEANVTHLIDAFYYF